MWTAAAGGWVQRGLLWWVVWEAGDDHIPSLSDTQALARAESFTESGAYTFTESISGAKSVTFSESLAKSVTHTAPSAHVCAGGRV